MSKMKVWWVPQIPMKPFEAEVGSLAEGVKLLGVLADYDIFQFENKIKPDYCNDGGLMVFEEESGEWTDWYDEESGKCDPLRFLEEKENDPDK